MLGILLIFVLTAACLSLLFWVGGVFLQGYFYTSPSDKLWWQAPAAGLSMATFLTIWCLINALSSGATPTNLPYDTAFRFSPREDMFDEPAKEIWLVRKKGPPVLYKRERIVDRYASGRYQYREASVAKKPWDAGVEAILLEYKGEKMRFAPNKSGEGDYRWFIAESGGWEMREYDDGPTGLPTAFRVGRFLAVLFLNGFHAILWFVCLWLLLRFNPSHALVMAFALWLTTTLVLLPVFFSHAGEVAQKRNVPTRTTSK